MKTAKRNLLTILALLLCILAAGCGQGPEVTVPTETTQPPVPTESGYLAATTAEISCCDEAGVVLGTLIRGSEVKYELIDGTPGIHLNDAIAFLPEDARIVSDPAQVIPEHTLYVRTAVNLRDAGGRLLTAFGQKGAAVRVTGFDYLEDSGEAHMYRVELDGQEGYVMPWYLAETEAEALANYDSGSYATHAARENRYGGGGAADLDYFPREKGPIDGNEMPSECRTLYICCWRIDEVDAYLEIAENSGINAFVVDITDGGSIGYAADVMNAYCPTGAAAAQNTVEEYRAAIQKIKDAGYYVIGRITTFNDTYFVKDHPEYAISDASGQALKLSKAYWPSPYCREAWQYKVDLAVEAVELMGFDEIQFDYVRFPDRTRSYEKAGTIDFRNTYGESAFDYVTAYGQYWPAISNVVDAISGMPYPDHFGAERDWLPWEHPYDTLYNWGQSVMVRQGETATPASVRTWIQAYNAIRKPYNTYGPEEVAAQIQALRDSGCTGGYMTWNAGSSLDKYQSLIPAFAPPEG